MITIRKTKIVVENVKVSWADFMIHHCRDIHIKNGCYYFYSTNPLKPGHLELSFTIPVGRFNRNIATPEPALVMDRETMAYVITVLGCYSKEIVK